MVIRIRFGHGPKVGRKTHGARRAALVVAALLTPGTAIALVFGCWRIAADLDWAGSFAISSGIFSHWQVWIGGAALLHLCSRGLTRYGKNGDTAIS